MTPEEAIKKIGLQIFIIHGIAYNGYTFFEEEIKTLKQLIEDYNITLKEYF